MNTCRESGVVWFDIYPCEFRSSRDFVAINVKGNHADIRIGDWTRCKCSADMRLGVVVISDFVMNDKYMCRPDLMAACDDCDDLVDWLNEAEVERISNGGAFYCDRCTGAHLEELEKEMAA